MIYHIFFLNVTNIYFILLLYNFSRCVLLGRPKRDSNGELRRPHNENFIVCTIHLLQPGCLSLDDLILKCNYLFLLFTVVPFINRFEIISSERFRIYEHIFSEARLHKLETYYCPLIYIQGFLKFISCTFTCQNFERIFFRSGYTACPS